MPAAYCYTRVSTQDQATDGVSLDAQKAKVTAWCEVHGYDLAETFVDAGLSGGRADNRPELQRALAAVCASPGSAIVVYSLSRLSRSVRDTLSIAARLERAGCDLVSLSEKLDTTTAAGRMVFKMLAVLAEFERDQLSERTRTAMQFKKSQGERVGTVPFGYSLGPDQVTLVAVPSEQEALALIRQLRDDGLSLRRIASELQARGVAAKNGGHWSHSTVQAILARVQDLPT